MGATLVEQPDRDAHGRQRARRRLRPLDEHERVLEVGLEIAPFGRRDRLEAIEIEVRDGDAALVAVADRERRARDRIGDPEGPAGAADEGRLPGAELAGDGDDVAGAQLAREPRRRRLGPCR